MLQYAGTWIMHQIYDWPASANYDCYTSIRTPTSDGNQKILEILVNPGLQPYVNRFFIRKIRFRF